MEDDINETTSLLNVRSRRNHASPDSINTNGEDEVPVEELDVEASVPKIDIDMSDMDGLADKPGLSVMYESLDYDVCENMIYHKDEQSRKPWYQFKKGLSCWLVFALIGISTGTIAFIIDLCVQYAADLKYYYIKTSVDYCVEHNCLDNSVIIWALTNGALVFVGALLTCYIAPVAAGSGIPQIKCYLNGVKVPGVVRVKTLFVKVVGVVCAVAGGLAVGKEGPMIHSGAVVAAGVSQGRSSTFRFDLKLFEYFRSDTEKRDFVSGGAAAGVSAAFGAPVGGVLFALEEGASFWNQALTWRIFFASMLSTVTLNIITSCRSGDCGDLSSPGLFNFGIFSKMEYSGVEIPLFIVMGAFGGLTGALFNFLNHKLTLWRIGYVYQRPVRVIEATLVATTSAALSFLIIFLYDDCQPMRADPKSNPVQFFCPDGQYSSTAGIFFQTPEEGAKRLFHDPEGTYTMVSLALYAIVFFVLACYTYGTFVPSGLFIPSLLIGAAWGRLVGVLLHGAFPDAEWLDSGKYALIGAAAQLGGIVRMTISLTVIIIEATGNITLGLPVMVVLMVSKWVGDLFNEGIYDMHVHLQGVPILGWEPPPMSTGISAREVMSHPATVLRTTENVGRIIDILKAEDHNGFPVVQDYDPDRRPSYSPEQIPSFGTFQGTILRSQLIVLLKLKMFEENADIKQKLTKMRPEDFRDAYPRFPPIQQIHVSPNERKFHIDLRPHMNTGTFKVPDCASLPRIFRLFRALGLRHVVVVNEHNEVLGMVTRKDLARYKVKWRLGKSVIEEVHMSR